MKGDWSRQPLDRSSVRRQVEAIINDPTEWGLRASVTRHRQGRAEDYLHRGGWSQEVLAVGDDVGLVLAAYLSHFETEDESPDPIRSPVRVDVLRLALYVSQRLTAAEWAGLDLLAGLVQQPGWEPIRDWCRHAAEAAPPLHPDGRRPTPEAVSAAG